MKYTAVIAMAVMAAVTNAQLSALPSCAVCFSSIIGHRPRPLQILTNARLVVDLLGHWYPHHWMRSHRLQVLLQQRRVCGVLLRLRSGRLQ